MMRPDRFYPIVDSVAWVSRLARLGARTIQLRAKDLPPDAAHALVRDALKAVAGTDAQLVVNDYWQAAIDARAHFVHLGQEDLASADIAAIRKAGIAFGLSTHDERERDEALRHAPDYIALGPIFPTILKVVPFAPQGLARIGAWKKAIGNIPLVAIGGITLERSADVFAAGADSIAVSTDLTTHTDPDSRARDWLARTSFASLSSPPTSLSYPSPSLSSPPPLRGRSDREAIREGGEAKPSVQANTPLPNPPPQGGRERSRARGEH